MQNLSSLSRIQYANIASITLFFIVVFIETYLHGVDFLRLLGIINFILAWYMFINIRKVKSLIKNLAILLKEAEDGNLEHRVTSINDRGELKELCSNINRLFDQVEVFLREVKAAVHSASEKKYYRKVLGQGLRGTFQYNAALVNKAVNSMEENQKIVQRSMLNE
ncbi:MAG: hypothetical protein RL154_430, partial [Pseudomonadota bacterium]